MKGITPMNKTGVLTTTEERENISWRDYKFPKEAGSITCTLKNRIWDRKHPCIICLFQTDDNEKIALRAWQKNPSGIEYSPQKSSINFDEDVRDDSRWLCAWEMSKKGFPDWQYAEKVVD